MSNIDPVSLTQKWLDLLKANGYRLTAPRQAVVEVLVFNQRVLSPMEVYEIARLNYPQLGLVTVYRTIEKLEELGLLQRVHQPVGCQGFIAALPEHQHLLICQECGLVVYFNDHHDQLDNLISAVANRSGYKIQDHWLQLFGFCSNCQTAS